MCGMILERLRHGSNAWHIKTCEVHIPVFDCAIPTVPLRTKLRHYVTFGTLLKNLRAKLIFKFPFKAEVFEFLQQRHWHC